MEVLLNILETDESRCKISALKVIRDVTYNSEISRALFNMRVCITRLMKFINPE